jgi:hypothetical protein
MLGLLRGSLMRNFLGTFSSAFCLAFLFSVIPTYADILDSWHWRNPTPFSDTMQSLCFGDGKFVVVGSGGVIHTSSDGQFWDDGQRPVLFTLNRVIYANGQFMAVGNMGTIITSTNGINWTPQNSGVTNDLLAVAFGNGLYVAVGTAGRVVISTNGSSWGATSAGTDALGWITFGNGVFVLPAADIPTGSFGATIVQVQVSENALTWTTEPIPAPVYWSYPHHLFQVEFGNGVFLAVVEDEVYYTGTYYPVGHLYQSSDGTNWIQGAQGGPLPKLNLGVIDHRFLTFAHGLFYEFTVPGNYNGDPKYILAASDASAYAQTLAPAGATDAKYLAYGAGRYVLFEDNGKCWTSIDATNWISSYSGFRNNIFQIIAGANKYVVIGSQPILVSTDGINFSAISNSPTFNGDAGPVYGIFNAVAFDGTNFVAVGGASSILNLLPPPGTAGFVYTSTNSTDWVSRTSNDNQILTAICRGSSRWVAVGQNGSVISSPNTLAWTLRASGTANTLNSVDFGNGNYVAAGNGGTIISSPDGATWDVQYSGTTTKLNCVRFGDGQFVAVGDGGTVLVSPDGESWSGVDSGTTKDLKSIAFGDGRYVICGTGLVLESANASNWQDISSKVPWVPGAGSVAFLNQSFWIAGGGGSILQSDSTDGIPHLTSAMLAENSGFQLKIMLNVPSTYHIQVSTNLAADFWQDVATNTASSTVWTDTNMSGFPIRLYRVASP